MHIVEEGLRDGFAMIGGRPIKFNRGERLIAEKGNWLLVENASRPVKGWVNYRLLVNDARRKKVSYQLAYSAQERRMAENVAWRRLHQEDSEMALWVQKGIWNDLQKR